MPLREAPPPPSPSASSRGPHALPLRPASGGEVENRPNRPLVGIEQTLPVAKRALALETPGLQNTSAADQTVPARPTSETRSAGEAVETRVRRARVRKATGHAGRPASLSGVASSGFPRALRGADNIALPAKAAQRGSSAIVMAENGDVCQQSLRARRAYSPRSGGAAPVALRPRPVFPEANCALKDRPRRT